MFAVNVNATAKLLEAARCTGVETFVLASTGGVYRPAEHALAETEPLHPPAQFYPATKLAAEYLARAYGDTMNVLVLRLFFVYGRGQDRSMLMPRLVDSIAAGRPVSLRPPDGLRMTPTHVDDAVAAIRASLSCPTDTINIAGPEVVAMRTIAETIGTKLGVTPVFEQVDGSGDYIADTTKMRSLLGPPTIGFEMGVQDLLDGR